MAVAPPSRVNYFDRQYIRLAELRDEQAYHVQMRRRHNLSHHSWGIVLGLEIEPQDDGQPAVRPGVAVDGYGRELLLIDRLVVGREIFDRYATSRLDLWLVYDLELTSDRLAPVDCDSDPRAQYRATERGRIEFTRGGARPDPRTPPGVPLEDLEEPLLATPDDPRRRWPVYLGRVTMALTASGTPAFEVDVTDRVYVGLNAEAIDHPGNAARLELGRRSSNPDTRTIDGETFTYEPDVNRDFAVFIPPRPDPVTGTTTTGVTVYPAIGVYADSTQIRGSAAVHGNLVLDGASLQFPDASDKEAMDADGHPSLYRFAGTAGDELRIDVGSLDAGDRKLVIGVTKNGEFQPAIEMSFPAALAGGAVNPLVTIKGDLRIEGNIKSDDIRTRTVSEEVAALVTGMVQAAIATTIANP
jgi:hypothetical protein